jgi:hypothetical protein
LRLRAVGEQVGIDGLAGVVFEARRHARGSHLRVVSKNASVRCRAWLATDAS